MAKGLVKSLTDVFDFFCFFIAHRARIGRRKYLSRLLTLDESVALGDVQVNGTNLLVGNHSYMNSGYISTSTSARVTIGKWCAIGYNVTILAMTHNVLIPTGPTRKRPVKKADVLIGNGVWIGNNVVITPGVKIGNYSVVGANSVVINDIPDHSVAAGNPAIVLYTKSEVDVDKHRELLDGYT